MTENIRVSTWTQPGSHKRIYGLTGGHLDTNCIKPNYTDIDRRPHEHNLYHTRIYRHWPAATWTQPLSQQDKPALNSGHLDTTYITQAYSGIERRVLEHKLYHARLKLDCPGNTPVRQRTYWDNPGSNGDFMWLLNLGDDGNKRTWLVRIIKVYQLFSTGYIGTRTGTVRREHCAL